MTGLQMSKAAGSIRQAFVSAVQPLVETGELRITETPSAESSTRERTRGYWRWRRQETIPVEIQTHDTRIESPAGNINITYRQTIEEKRYVTSQALEVTMPRAGTSDLFTALASAVGDYAGSENGYLYENDGPHLAPVEHPAVTIEEEADRTVFRFNPLLVRQEDDTFLYSWTYGVRSLNRTLAAEVKNLILRRYRDEHSPKP